MDFQRISTAFAQRAAQLGSNSNTNAINNNDAVENIEPLVQRARECLHSHSGNEITTRSFDRFAVAAVDIIALSPIDSERAAFTTILTEPTDSLSFESKLEVQAMRIHTCFHALAARIRPTYTKESNSRVLSALKDLLHTHSLETFAQADRAAWTLFVAILCLLPDKISNAYASETSAIDAFFMPLPFTQRIIDDILDSRVVMDDMIASQMALLLTKLCRLNRYDLIASNLIQKAQINSEPIFSKLILRIDADQLLKLMLSVLKQLSLRNYSVAKAGRIFEFMFPNEEVSQHNSAMSIFRDFSMLVKLGEPEIMILCGYYAKFSSKTGLQIFNALEECLSLWASASFAKNSTETAHLSLTTAILVSFAHNNFSSLEPERSRRLENVLNQGMHIYLSSTVEVKRKSGMVLGECFTKAIRPNTPLSFELDNNDTLVKKLRSLVILSSNDEGSKELTVSATGNGLALASLQETSKLDRHREKVMEQDPDAFVEDLIAGNESDDESERDDSKKDVNSSDESDGDDLVPLATPDDHINSKKPFFLRDCLKNLRSEDPDIIEITLQSLSSLIASANLNDLSNILQDLYPRLLNLQNTYQLDDFELYVQEAIVGMGVRVPKLAARFLNAGLMEDEKMLMGRVAILRYMAFTVTAGRNRGELVSRNSDSAMVKSTASASSFSSSLPDFFYPLVDGFAFLYGLNAVEDLSHNILVESFLKTAALIVKCSENTTHCLKMARELLQLALNINFATHDANTKSTLLLVLGITLSAPPKQLLHIEFDSRILNACSEYLDAFIANEADRELVDKAEQLVYLLRRLNKMFDDAVPYSDPACPTRVIVVAIDASKHAQKAFDWALDHMCRGSGDASGVLDEIVLLNCRPVAATPSVPVGDEIFAGAVISSNQDYQAWAAEQTRIESHTLLKKYAHRVMERNKGVIVRAIALEGDTREELCNAAKQLRAECVVMGSQGMSLVSKLMVGSVSDHVLHHASCPVIVVR
ncbi:hypothetical protein HDU80_003822 [Chytriomyces hyalinus]|nr:hypothetical protein HDU80_003822 [Chytriomyces hyalinus]